jgi:hypothetical protein
MDFDYQESTGHEFVLFLFCLQLFLFLRIQLGLFPLLLVAFVLFSSAAHELSPFTWWMLSTMDLFYTGKSTFQQSGFPASSPSPAISGFPQGSASNACATSAAAGEK